MPDYAIVISGAEAIYGDTKYPTIFLLVEHRYAGNESMLGCLEAHFFDKGTSVA